MQLTDHFSLAELTVTETGLDNTPAMGMLPRLKTLAIFLEKVRAVLGGHPISIDSAYRSPAVNTADGGVHNSAHELGYAADIVCTSFGSPFAIAKALDAAQVAGKIEFDQLIYEGAWVHISRDPQLRAQRLTLIGPGTYTSGIVGP